MFFYYFGHGLVTGEDDPDSNRAWLVPVDAPDPIKNEMKFFRLAVPMSDIVGRAKRALIKHAFFAFEACRAGYVITSLSTLGSLEPPHIKGYVLDRETQRPVRQFLTAGNTVQQVPANNSFTALLAGALVDPAADTNGDGFITGKKIISYVALRLPQWATDYHLHPEAGSIPPVEGGDMVFGPTVGRNSGMQQTANQVPPAATSARPVGPVTEEKRCYTIDASGFPHLVPEPAIPTIGGLPPTGPYYDIVGTRVSGKILTFRDEMPLISKAFPYRGTLLNTLYKMPIVQNSQSTIMVW